MSRGESEAMNCPVCGRTAPVGANRRLGFHYAETTHSLRVCVAVDVRADDHRTVAQLQLAHRMALALDRLSVMVAAAAPVLERVAVAIEERTAAALQAADDYRRAVAAMEDDSGPIPAPVDDDDAQTLSERERDAMRNAILHMSEALNVDAPKGKNCADGWVLLARAVLSKVREMADDGTDDGSH